MKSEDVHRMVDDHAPDHPIDRASYYQELASYAAEQHRKQAAINERDGVPER